MPVASSGYDGSPQEKRERGGDATELRIVWQITSKAETVHGRVDGTFGVGVIIGVANGEGNCARSGEVSCGGVGVTLGAGITVGGGAEAMAVAEISAICTGTSIPNVLNCPFSCNH